MGGKEINQISYKVPPGALRLKFICIFLALILIKLVVTQLIKHHNPPNHRNVPSEATPKSPENNLDWFRF